MLISAYQDCKTRVEVHDDAVVISHLGDSAAELRNGRGVIDTAADLLNKINAGPVLFYCVKDLLRSTEEAECRRMKYKTEIVVEGTTRNGA